MTGAGPIVQSLPEWLGNPLEWMLATFPELAGDPKIVDKPGHEPGRESGSEGFGGDVESDSELNVRFLDALLALLGESHPSPVPRAAVAKKLGNLTREGEKVERSLVNEFIDSSLADRHYVTESGLEGAIELTALGLRMARLLASEAIAPPLNLRKKS
jgi:hypothetical protein